MDLPPPPSLLLLSYPTNQMLKMILCTFKRGIKRMLGLKEQRGLETVYKWCNVWHILGASYCPYVKIGLFRV